MMIMIYTIYTKQYPILSSYFSAYNTHTGDKVEKPKSKRFGKFGSSMRGGFGKLSKKKSQDDISSKASHEIGKFRCRLYNCLWCAYVHMMCANDVY